MNETFASVLLFHTALKTYFTGTLGWTVERSISSSDEILTNGSGVFLRLRRVTSSGVSALGLELGSDADTLALSTKDPELVLPFDTSAGGVFQAVVVWLESAGRLELTILGSGDRWAKRYFLQVMLTPPGLSVEHRDHLNHALEPNFKVRGGPYIQAGV